MRIYGDIHILNFENGLFLCSFELWFAKKCKNGTVVNRTCTPLFLMEGHLKSCNDSTFIPDLNIRILIKLKTLIFIEYWVVHLLNNPQYFLRHKELTEISKLQKLRLKFRIECEETFFENVLNSSQYYKQKGILTVYH